MLDARGASKTAIAGTAATATSGLAPAMTATPALPPKALSVETAPRSESAELREARRLLSLAKAAPKSGITFGGRIEGASANVGVALARYYDSVSIARSLGDIRALHGARLAFSHQVPVPASLRAPLSEALQVQAGLQREPSAPVGATPIGDAETFVGTAVDDGAVFAPDDPSVRAFFAQNDRETLDTILSRAPAHKALDIIRTFSRAKELDASIDASSVGDWNALEKHVPATQDGARVLLRLANAYARAPSSIPFAGGTLATDVLVADGAELARALGTVSATPRQVARSLTRSDTSELALDDASIVRLAESWGGPEAWTGLLEAGSGQATLCVIRLAVRAAELGQEIAFSPEQPRVCAALTESTAGRQVLRRLIRASARLDEDAAKAFHALLPEPYAPVRRRRGAAQFASGPVGTRTVGAKSFEDLAAEGPEALQLADSELAAIGSDTILQAAKAHESNPAVLLAFAKLLLRGGELELNSFELNRMNLEYFGHRMGDSPEARGVLARIERVCGTNRPSIDIGQHGRLVLDGLPDRPLAGPLGDLERTTPELLDAALKVQGPELNALSDASIHALFEQRPDPSDWPAPVHVDARGHAQRLALMVRGLDLGAVQRSAIRSYIAETLHPRAAEDRHVMRWIAAFEIRDTKADRGWDESNTFLIANRAKSDTWGPFLDAKAALEGEAAIAAEPAPRAFDPTQDAPLGDRIRKVTNDWKNRDPGLFTANDESLDELAGSQDVSGWLEWWDMDPRVLRLASRCIELNLDDGASARAFLAEPAPAALTTNTAVPELVRFARAAGVDPGDVTFAIPAAGAATLADHPAYERLARPVTADDIADRHQPFLDVLNPGSGADDEGRRRAVLDLLTAPPSRERMEARNILDVVAELRADGALSPVDAGATAKERTAFLRAIVEGIGHGGIGLLVAATVTKNLDPLEVSEALRASGWPANLAAPWSGIAITLNEVDGALARAWMRPVIEGGPVCTADFATAITLEEAGVSEPSLRRALMSVEDEEPVEFLTALLETIGRDATDVRRKAVGSIVRSVIADGRLDPGQLDGQGRSDVLRLLDATLEPRAEAAIEKISTKDPERRRVGAHELVDVLQSASELGEASDLFDRTLRRVLQLDLQRVMPLDVASEKIQPEPDAGEARAHDGVVVAGIPLSVNRRPDRDKTAIPRQAKAEMVMTPTTEANLRRLAVGWRNGQAVLLEGPTGAGKTAAVRYIAHLTDTPYRRINLTYHTEVDDLIGRWVGGSREHDLASMEAMNEEVLGALGREYGVEDDANRAALIAAILSAQDTPRWVDGPLITAMRKGEVLLLDEVNLARPEVLERLNSLLDGDGNIVLTEHGNEVITPEAEFRIVATMNPATYSGRGDLSDAFRSRWNTVFAHGLDEQDIRMVLGERYGDAIPPNEAIKLIKAHEALARDADAQAIGRASGGVAFTLRNLFRVTERFLRYRDGALDDAALLRRETEEIYLGGLFEEGDIAHVRDVLDALMPNNGPGFYDNLEFTEDERSVTIGDVVLPKVNVDGPTVPSESARLVPTRRTVEVMYRLAKAMDMGENAALIGERASGKTAIAKMMAMLRGQPYARQNLNGGTDSHQLIGGYGPHGWEDGLIAQAGREDAPPSVVVLDEYNLGAPAVVERLNSLFDDERKLVLAEKAPPEEIRFSNDVHFVATFNPPTRKYAGRSKLSPAAMNRFTPIWVPPLEDPEEQLEIMRVRAEQHGVDKVVAAALVELHGWIVEGYAEGRLGKNQSPRMHPVYSVRTLEKAVALVGDLTDDLGVDGAYLAAVESLYGASADPEDTDAIFTMAKEIAA